jgi:hypothetical protein
MVIEGIYPGGLRTQVHDRLLNIEQQFSSALRRFDGDAARFEPVEEQLSPLLIKATPQPQKNAGAGNAVPLLRYEPAMRPVFSVQMTFVLLIFVVLLTFWRLWHTLQSLPPIALSVIEFLSHSIPQGTL